ncbi:hypothetical protein BGZ65_010404 [Modicella reniformis]|uniref:F-box domain-containing protein n=1 Tax=Modicella reniformis TaxID=1440133 RepID=A0A9P6IMW1_9FUNG|nr:hypothetical protein BGZ65_010404 [Modicella reniformis]
MHSVFEVPELVGLIAQFLTQRELVLVHRGDKQSSPTVLLVGLIAQFLTQRELVNSMSTCRLLHAQFEQYRWRRLFVPTVHEDSIHRSEREDVFEALWSRPSGSEARALMRNRHHLRSVSVNIFAHLFLKILSMNEPPRRRTSGSPPVGPAQFKAASPSPPRITLPSSTHTTPPPAVSLLAAGDISPSFVSTLSTMVRVPLILDPAPQPLRITNLRTLHIDISHLAEESRWRTRDVIPTTTSVLRLLDTNPLITHLHLPASVLVYQWAIDSLLNIIDNQLLMLVHLTFGNNHMLNVPFEHCPPLLHALCRHKQLKDLHCLFTTTYNNYEHSKFFEIPPRPCAESFRSSRYLQTDPRELLTEPSMSLRAVTLPRSNQSVPLAMVLRFLNNCVPYLEDLEVPEFVQPVATVLEPLVMLGSSTLQHIRFEQAPHIDESVSKAVLLACETLKSFRAGFLRDVKWIITWLAKTHTRSLEEIKVHDSCFFTSGLIRRLLRDCTHLKEFSMNKNMNKSGLRLHDVMTGRWSCFGLKILRLIICRSMVRQRDENALENPQEDSHETMNIPLVEPQEGGYGTSVYQDSAEASNGGAEDARTLSMSCQIVEGVAKLYQQIGRLTQLEILDLRYASLNDDRRDPYEEDYATDLTLSGGLQFLSGLTSLRQLVLISDLWTAMGQCEVEFMADNWPKLEVIAFGTAAKMQEWTKSECFGHWRWLERQRPGLRLVFLECNDQEV